MPDGSAQEHPTPPPWAPPGWLRILVVLTALACGVVETMFLGARPASYAFVLAVLFGTEGIGALAKTRGMLR